MISQHLCVHIFEGFRGTKDTGVSHIVLSCLNSSTENVHKAVSFAEKLLLSGRDTKWALDTPITRPVIFFLASNYCFVAS